MKGRKQRKANRGLTRESINTPKQKRERGGKNALERDLGLLEADGVVDVPEEIRRVDAPVPVPRALPPRGREGGMG